MTTKTTKSLITKFDFTFEVAVTMSKKTGYRIATQLMSAALSFKGQFNDMSPNLSAWRELMRQTTEFTEVEEDLPAEMVNEILTCYTGAGNGADKRLLEKEQSILFSILDEEYVDTLTKPWAEKILRVLGREANTTLAASLLVKATERAVRQDEQRHDKKKNDALYALSCLGYNVKLEPKVNSKSRAVKKVKPSTLTEGPAD